MAEHKFHHSLHAQHRLEARGIAQSWIERTVLAPEHAEPVLIHPNRIRAFRAVPERGGRILRVVYVRDRDTIRFVTALLDRGRRRVSRAGQVRS